jgi:hypothetical protein
MMSYLLQCSCVFLQRAGDRTTSIGRDDGSELAECEQQANFL